MSDRLWEEQQMRGNSEGRVGEMVAGMLLWAKSKKILVFNEQEMGAV